VNAAIAERTIDIEGLPVRYLTAGSGPPLVHGVGTSAVEWSWVLPTLAPDHLVYAIDLPGFNGSARPPITRRPLRTLRWRVPRCLEARASRGDRQLARRTRSPAPGALRPGARLRARLVRQRRPGPSGESGSGGAQLTRRRRAGDDVGQDASRRCRVGFPSWVTTLRASLADSPKVAQGPVSAGADTELHGSDASVPPCDRLSGRTTRGLGRSTPSPQDADAYRVGSRGQGISSLARERGSHSPARGFTRIHPQLWPPASRRATANLRVYRGSIPQRKNLRRRGDENTYDRVGGGKGRNEQTGSRDCAANEVHRKDHR